MEGFEMKTFTTPEIVSLNIEETANGLPACTAEHTDCPIIGFLFDWGKKANPVTPTDPVTPVDPIDPKQDEETSLS